jgi:hypothetical protein
MRLDVLAPEVTDCCLKRQFQAFFQGAKMTIRFRAREFKNARDAMQYADIAGGRAILLGLGTYVVSEDDATRLGAAGVEFAFLCEFELPDGTPRVMTIPV